MNGVNYHKVKINVLRRIAIKFDECNQKQLEGEHMIRVNFHKGNMSRKIKFSFTITEEVKMI